MKVKLFYKGYFFVAIFFMLYASFILCVLAYFHSYYSKLAFLLPIFLYFLFCIKIIFQARNIFYRNGYFYRKKQDDKIELEGFKKPIFYLLKAAFIAISIILTMKMFSDIFGDNQNSYKKILLWLLFINLINFLLAFTQKRFTNRDIFKQINIWNIFIIITAAIFRFHVQKFVIKYENDFYTFLAIISVFLIANFVSFLINSPFEYKNINKNPNLSKQVFILIENAVNLLKDISLTKKHSRLYYEIFKIKKTLLSFSKTENLIGGNFHQIDIEYFNFLKSRFSELEELYFNKNFEIKNWTLKDELKYIKYSSIYGF